MQLRTSGLKDQTPQNPVGKKPIKLGWGELKSISSINPLFGLLLKLENMLFFFKGGFSTWANVPTYQQM